MESILIEEERKSRRKLKTWQSCQGSAMAISEGVWDQSHRNLFKEDTPKELLRSQSSCSPAHLKGSETLSPGWFGTSTMLQSINGKAESLNSFGEPSITQFYLALYDQLHKFWVEPLSILLKIHHDMQVTNWRVKANFLPTCTAGKAETNHS